MTTSIIIVTYNSAGTIADCLESVLKGKPTQVVVVDNHSSDDTLTILQRYQSRITLVANPHNEGFNDGNVRGAAQANGDILIFLNPDTRVPADFVTNIVGSLQDPQRGVVGTRILNVRGETQVSGSRFPSLASLLYDGSQYRKLFLTSQARNRFLILDWDRQSPRYIDAVAGACFALRQSTYAAIGGFDTHYFLFFEEYDLGRAIGRQGLRTYYDSSIAVTHLGHISTDQVASASITRIYNQSRDYYIRKHHGVLFLAVFKALCRGIDLAWALKNKLST